MLAPNKRKESLAQYTLHYGNSRTALVTVAPDNYWPEMYRLHWPDSRVSDMASLARAKDAAA